MWFLVTGTVVVAAAVYAGRAVATPANGFSAATLAQGSFGEIDVANQFLREFGDATPRKDLWLSMQRTKGDSELFVQSNLWTPGGFTGWHTHPGPTFVAVAAGEGTLYHAMSGCPSTKYGVNSGFLQPPTEVHNMRNEGSTPLVLWAFYALPPGTENAAIRIDEPQPTACPNIQ
jgi:quercetin dioxygenase-like cupin family protein